MPFKTDKLKLGDPTIDRRVKMLPSDKELAKKMHSEGVSIRGIARYFKVDKRNIQFILFPERHEKNLQDRKKRGGTKQYYDRLSHNNAMKDHRRYKYLTLLEDKDNSDFINKANIDKIKKYDEKIVIDYIS